MTQIIESGKIITSPSLSEPCEVLLYQPRDGGYVRLVGKLLSSQSMIDDVLSPTQIEALQIVETEVGFTADARHAFLALEAKRYRYAAYGDPTLAVSISKVDPLPHQIDAVWHILRQTRIRFLIADDPGAGKTIMAGLIAKELKLRNQIERILIVTPGHLVDQWTREMKIKFKEDFTHVNRSSVKAHQWENIWNREQQLITSMDFARQDDIRDSIAGSHKFDLIIVDEAHKMAAHRYGSKIDKTKRYQLGECLTNQTTHLLFLTATPHTGKSEDFQLFLSLLEPSFFADSTQTQESIKIKNNPLFIRRVKESLEDFEGNPLFLPRNVRTKPFFLSAESENEKQLYDDLSDYIREQYNRFSDDPQKRNNVAFALVTLQKRLASSTYALLRSLQNRRKRLMEMLSQASIKPDKMPTDQEIDDDDALEESERWEQEKLWERLSVAENKDELIDEIEILNILEYDAKVIIDSESEIKLRELKDALHELNVDQPNEKILIFTESLDTLIYLQQKVKKWDFSVSVIHGGMSYEKRLEAQETFKNRTQIMIATEAAGEGINLQFCHMMINYDLPWNPNRLEQRMGRIHRYGQTKEVHIINLVSADTREGQVFNVLFEKLRTIRDELGSDKVFDVLSELLPEKKLKQLLSEAASGLRDQTELKADLDASLEKKNLPALLNFERNTLVSSTINFPRVKDLHRHAREQAIVPEYTRRFFQKALATLECKINLRNNGFFTISNIPREIQKIFDSDQSKQRSSAFRNIDFRRMTFDKQKALDDPNSEFISFGHPLFDATLLWVEQKFSNSLREGACFKDPDGRFDGIIVFYEGEIQDGTKEIADKKLFSFYLPQDGDTVELINPVVIWDFEEHTPISEPVSIADFQAKVEQKLYPLLEEERFKIEKERQRQVNIREKYALVSLNQLIAKLESELDELNDRKASGMDVRLAIHNKSVEKDRYEEAKAKLKEICRNEVTLSISTPTFAGAIRVKPATIENVLPTNRQEIEQVGMDVAIQHEKARGCSSVEDVSKNNLGFDIRSTTPDGKIRCIEVKARSNKDSVVLTPNEWFQANQLKDDYFLYVVLNAQTQPELHIIQNPAERITDVKQITEVRYQIPLMEITKER